jgi:dTDP-4-amino-4,6-dideoxygalactose transaminase
MEGINSRLDGMQAILNAKLPHILKWTEDRIVNAAIYDSLLKDVSQIEIPKVRDVKHSYHLYVIKTERRDEQSILVKMVLIQQFIILLHFII